MSELEFVLHNYPGSFNASMMQILFSICKNKIVIYGKGEIKGLAFYFKLTDETLKRISSREMSLTIPENVNSCLLENGDNVHFFLLVADGYKTIRKGLRKIRDGNIKTVSWFSSDMKQFFIRRILCHQLS